MGTLCMPEVEPTARASLLIYMHLAAARRKQTIPPVCTENLIRVDDVMESPKLRK
jgi:hypothetical protein